MSTDRSVSTADLASTLSQMVESTTTADLVRSKGQDKKVKVLSQRKLMEWISTMLEQRLSSQENLFSDDEKGELLRKTQEELTQRIQREQTAETERKRLQAELEAALAKVAAGGGEADGAVATLRARLAETEEKLNDLQQDNYEVHDQLQEKLNLLSSTIAEKDRMRGSLRDQMMRSTALLEGVLALDERCYAGRHAADDPVPEDAAGDQSFYHDFDVAIAVVNSLGIDIDRIRSLAAERGAADEHLLAADIAALTQGAGGADLHAPVADLVEALSGARQAAESIDAAIAKAVGTPTRPITDVPDADGIPANVIASATTVLRDVTAELLRQPQRIAALASMTTEAEQARGQLDDELERARAELAAAKAQAAAAVAAAKALAAAISATAGTSKSAQVEESRLDLELALSELGDDQGASPEVLAQIAAQGASTLLALHPRR